MANSVLQNSLYIGSDEQRTAAEVSRHCFVHDAVVLGDQYDWQHDGGELRLHVCALAGSMGSAQKHVKVDLLAPLFRAGRTQSLPSQTIAIVKKNSVGRD